MHATRSKSGWQQYLLVLLVLFACSAFAQAPDRGAQIRAAFVYNFAKFVEWPTQSFASPTSPLHLCALSNSRQAARLDLIAGRSAQGHPIVLTWVSDVAQVRDCQMLYLTHDDLLDHPQLLAATLHQPVLTIGEDEAFLAQGGMVALFVKNEHVRFSINQSRADASGLKISARLLQLARNVR